MAARGRGLKGNRVGMLVRVERDHHEVYVEQATRAGMYLSDYIAWQLARLHELPVPGYLRDAIHDPQQLRLEVDAKKSA